MTITLRPYQRAAVDGLYMYWQTDKGSHPLIVAPTGAGKTAIIGQIVSDAIAFQSRVVILAHVKELIEQGARTLQAMVPNVKIGIYSASLKSKDLSQPITYGQIQSIHKRAQDMPAPDLVIIDEAHLVTNKLKKKLDTYQDEEGVTRYDEKKGMTRYGAFIDAILARNPECKIVGLTATPYRLDQGWLHKGKTPLFDGVAHEIKIADLMQNGWLSPIRAKAVSKSIDLTGVRTRGGEYREDDLAKAASDPDLIEAAAKEMAELGANRNAWLAFCCGIEHATLVASALLNHGIDAEVLTGKHNSKERNDIIDRFKAGELRCLVNVNVLTTGFDAPNVDLLALLRATKSPGLYVQMVGRGTRLYEGKTDCLVLDYGSNVTRHGLIDDVQPQRKDGDASPVKSCKECKEYVPTAAKVCPYCGYFFEPEPMQARHESKSYEGALLTSQQKPEQRKPDPYKWLSVSHVAYALHKKEGKPDSVKVTYVCGISTVNEWLCPEHGGYPTQKYMDRLIQMKCGHAPETAAEALAKSRTWPMPTAIKVKRDGDFLQVVEVSFE